MVTRRPLGKQEDTDKTVSSLVLQCSESKYLAPSPTQRVVPQELESSLSVCRTRPGTLLPFCSRAADGQDRSVRMGAGAQVTGKHRTPELCGRSGEKQSLVGGLFGFFMGLASGQRVLGNH